MNCKNLFLNSVPLKRLNVKYTMFDASFLTGNGSLREISWTAEEHVEWLMTMKFWAKRPVFTERTCKAVWPKNFTFEIWVNALQKACKSRNSWYWNRKKKKKVSISAHQKSLRKCCFSTQALTLVHQLQHAETSLNQHGGACDIDVNHHVHALPTLVVLRGC